MWSAGTPALGAPGSASIAEAVMQLEADHDQATEAVYVLKAGGARAAKRIREAWPRLSLLAQRRALPALFTLAKTHDAALETLSDAARSNDEDLRDRAFEALGRSGVRGREALAALVTDDLAGDRAASLLARVSPDAAVQPLLAAIEEPGGLERTALRSALATAVQRADTNAGGTLRDWLEASPPPVAVAYAAMGLVGVESQRATLTSFVEYAARGANDFASKWRLLKSSAVAGPSEPIDAFVRRQLAEAEEWMLREAAVEALTARGIRDAARPSLKDPYPRVRRSAAGALAGDHLTMLERATLARRDTWPMVRAAAVRSLRTEGEAVAVVVAAVDDSMSEVRAAAIETLGAASHAEGWDQVHRRLAAGNEWPQVTEAAIEYVVAHCRTDAAEALFGVVMRATPANALTEDLNNAARAIGGLRALGTPEALAAVEQLRNTPGVPPTLKMALEQPPDGDAGCPQVAP